MELFNHYIMEIRRDFPDFPISSVRQTGEGDNSVAFIINQKYIFRFPKRKQVKLQLQREIDVLPLISPSFQLQLPDFKFISPSLAFAAYELIEGKPLTASVYHSLTPPCQRSVKRSLALFLSRLHQPGLLISKAYGLETMDMTGEYSGNLQDAITLIYPHLPLVRQKKITAYFENYLHDPDNFRYDPVLIHNDFSSDHILFNDHHCKITGVIDFGDIAWGDPDYDFLYLYDELGEAFIGELLRPCSPSRRETAVAKIRFFSLANKIQILLDTLKSKEKKDTRAAFKNLGAWLKKDNTRERS